jgi:hypothetical protein
MKSSRAFKILSIVMLAAVVLYFGVQIYQYLANPFATTLTYEAEAENVNSDMVIDKILSTIPVP